MIELSGLCEPQARTYHGIWQCHRVNSHEFGKCWRAMSSLPIILDPGSPRGCQRRDGKWRWLYRRKLAVPHEKGDMNFECKTYQSNYSYQGRSRNHSE